MALAPNHWYVKDGSSIGWSGVTAWAAATSKNVGDLVRQNATPSVGNERVFVCVVAGTTHATTEPTWTVTKGAKNTDNTATWQEVTGQPAMNGDVTNTKPWEASVATSLGLIIKNIAGTYYFICDTSSGNTSGSEPSFDTTAGNTTNDGSNVWRCLGAVGGFSAWAAPHRRIANAQASTWAAAGDTIYVSDNHAYTVAGSITTLGGTAAAPIRILCVDDAAAPPTALAATGSESTTGANAITLGGFGYYYGLAFNAGSSGNTNVSVATGTASVGITLDTCVLKSNSGGSGSRIFVGNGASSSINDCFVSIRDTSFLFTHASQQLGVRGGNIEFIGCSFAPSATVPTNLFLPANAFYGNPIFRDCDFSAITGTLMNAAFNAAFTPTLINCKLGSGVTPLTGSVTGWGGVGIKLHNCDSASTNYRFYEQNYFATLQQETTIVRSGGATDGDTPISWNVASTANVNFVAPYASPPISIWNSATGSGITATIYLASNTGSLTNADVWVEFEYLGTSGNPLGLNTSTRAADVFATPASLTSDGVSSWGGSPSNKYKITSASFTPQKEGWVRARVFVADPSLTIYVDPFVEISGNAVDRAYLMPGDGFVNTFASGGGGGGGTTVHGFVG